MTFLIKIPVFFLGIYLSIRVLAAIFTVVDFWHIKEKAYPRMIMGILIWGGITAIVIKLTWPLYFWALLRGARFYINFIIIAFLLTTISAYIGLRKTPEGIGYSAKSSKD